MGCRAAATFDKTITQIPIVGLDTHREKGVLIVITLHILGPVDDTTVTSKSAGALTKSVAESLLRMLKLPRILLPNPGMSSCRGYEENKIRRRKKPLNHGLVCSAKTTFCGYG